MVLNLKKVKIRCPLTYNHIIPTKLIEVHPQGSDAANRKHYKGCNQSIWYVNQMREEGLDPKTKFAYQYIFQGLFLVGLAQ
jgi:hypothetical protein